MKRVSSEVKSRSGKWWLDFLFWLRDLNSKITPLGVKPRGAFTIFKRQSVEQIGGFDPNKPTWDTAFDLKLEARGWEVKRVRDVVVTERRDFTISRLIWHQIADGKARRKLRLSFLRTLLHSIFRGRFLLYMVTYKKRGERKLSNVSKHRRPVITYVSSVHDAYKEFPSKDVSITKEVVRTFEDVSPMLWEDNYGYVIEEHNPGKIIKVWRKHTSTLWRRIENEDYGSRL